MRTSLRCCTLAIFLTGGGIALAQAPEGRQSFQSRCAACHGTDGNGGEHGPSILARVRRGSEDELIALLREGVPQGGMPAFKDTPETELKALTGFLKTTLAPARGRRGQPVQRITAQLTDGKSLEGEAIGSTSRELQLRTADQRIHLLRKAGGKYREVTSQVDWTSYHGQLSGNRHTAMTQIGKANVSRLALQWVFAVPNAARLQGTPQVYDGVMYVTNTNAVSALDAGSGARLWQFTRPPHDGPGGQRAVAGE